MFFISRLLIPILWTSLLYAIHASPLKETETEISNSLAVAREIQQSLQKIRSGLAMYNVILDDVLTPRYEAVQLQQRASVLAAAVAGQLATLGAVKERLARHEDSVNASLARQESELARLEPHLLALEQRERRAASELEQLRQLWSGLSEGAVARAAEVAALEAPLAQLERRLEAQEAAVERHEVAASALQGGVDGAEEALRSMQDDLQEALNAQGRLEGVLASLQRKAEADAAAWEARSGVDPAPAATRPQADALCARFSAPGTGRQTTL